MVNIHIHEDRRMKRQVVTEKEKKRRTVRKRNIPRNTQERDSSTKRWGKEEQRQGDSVGGTVFP